MFLNCSTCFERQTTHHQELKTVIAASGFTNVCGCRQLSWLSRNCSSHSRILLVISIRYIIAVSTAVPTQPWQLPATTNVRKTRGCNYSFWAPAITVFEFLMMRGVPLETCWVIKKYWNNKFYYKVASCWFFLWDLYYDAWIHEHQGAVWFLRGGATKFVYTV